MPPHTTNSEGNVYFSIGGKSTAGAILLLDKTDWLNWW